MNDTQALTQLEFKPSDHTEAQRIARALGYEQTAYTSTSALWGLFCLKENPARYPTKPHRDACVIKTRELGLLVVILAEDLDAEPFPKGGAR
jgi:hypothetical protein